MKLTIPRARVNNLYSVPVKNTPTMTHAT